MWRQTLKIFLVTLIVVLTIGGVGIYLFRSLSQSEIRKAAAPPQVAKTSPPKTHPKKTVPVGAKARANHEKADRAILKRFVSEGWSRKAADGFQKLSGSWLTMLRRVDPPAYTRQVTLLAALGKQIGLMPFIEKHPESAALFTLAVKPAKLLRLFESSGKEYDFLVNLYAIHAAPMDVEQLTEALRSDSDLIARLYRRGLVGSEAIFLFDRDNEGGYEYDQWLRENLSAKLDSSDAELASLLNMVLTYGPDIRLRLRRDESFRRTFRTTIWPRLIRVAAANHNMFDLYLEDPRIWDLLALPEGEELLRLRGLLPIDLLYGYPELGRAPYPDDLHGTVIRALLQGDEDTIRALLKFRDEPLFFDLARRNVSTGVKNAAFKKLFEAGDNYRELLRRYAGMSDRGLAAEVGPPPNLLKTWTPLYYTFWEVPRKLIQGRDPNSSDWLNCLADPASFLYPILKIGVVAVNIRNTVLGIEQDDEHEQGLKGTGIQIAERQLGAKLAAKLNERQLLPFGMTGMLVRLQESYRQRVAPGAIVDATGPIRFMLGYSGAGKSSLKALKILDGRFLLLGDGRIVVQPGNDFPDREVKKYLAASVLDFKGEGTDVNSANKRHSPHDESGQSSPDELTDWRRNVSCWWLMQASGMLQGNPTGLPRSANLSR